MISVDYKYLNFPHTGSLVTIIHILEYLNVPIIDFLLIKYLNCYLFYCDFGT